MDEMEEALKRHAGERGLAKLKQALKAYRPRPFDKSGLERSVGAAIARDPRFPKPKRNWHQLAGGILWELDFFFEKERVALEVDGGQYHLTPQDRERDRLKDAKLLAEGIKPVRITDVRWELDRAGALDDLLAVVGIG
jgi:very-short-patch-repair endonuclease